MGFLFGALLLAYLALVILRAFAKASPAQIRQMVRRAGGAVVLAAALAVSMTGHIAIAAVLVVFGFWCLGQGFARQLWGTLTKSSKRTGISRMRSAMIEMEFDHASKAISGSVLAGAFEGRRLDDLSRSECGQLHAACLYHDAGGARLLETYLDRRFAGWRVAGKGQADAGRASDVRSRAGAMSHEEAYEILGLRHGAGREDIVRAHRTLMKKWHPDHGGSTDLAARVNEAKEVLMRRHL